MLTCSITLLSALLATAVGLIVALTTIFVLEVVAATLRYRDEPQQQSANGSRRRIGVLVPAHNESGNLLPTLADIKAQLGGTDRLLVVADNCSDDTAAVASQAGAQVVERRDCTKVGKGFALDWGIRHLRKDPPSIVIIIDADCRLGSDTLDQLAMATLAAGSPAQALYLMTATEGSPNNYKVAEFA